MPGKYVRKRLSKKETMPAVGAALGAGAAVAGAVFYVARLILQRAPSHPDVAPGTARAQLLPRPRSSDALPPGPAGALPPGSSDASSGSDSTRLAPGETLRLTPGER